MIGRRTIVGMAAALPLASIAARAQGRRRLVGVLSPFPAEDAYVRSALDAFWAALADLGWTERDLAFETRFAAGDAERLQAMARELVALAPDAILATNSIQTVAALKEATGSIPIVFGSASDPTALGLVESLARPGGNITGFTTVSAATNGRYIELIREFDASIEHALVLLSSEDPSNAIRYRAIAEAGRGLGVPVGSAEIGDPAAIDQVFSAIASGGRGAVIVLSNGKASTHRRAIVASAARWRVPAFYPFRYFVESGGLASYGPDQVDQFRKAAGYVHRILRGEKPGSLPIQTPTKFELAINLKAAAGLGLAVPPMLLARADEVIE